MVKKIGIVGYGTIGSYLYRKIGNEDDLRVEFVHDIDKSKLAGLASSLVINSIEEARERRPDLVVEVASSEWVKHFASVVLTFSDLLVVSVAAFAEEGLQEKLDAVAKANRTRYYISHGAIIGLDGVRDGREIIEEVKITTIRPQEGYGLKENISVKTVLYDGPTRKACQLFPKNVNIHASLALYGLGFDKTHSTVIADPESRVMRHIIEVKGRGLAWTIDVQAKPLGERTGAYAPESVFQTVKRICAQGYGKQLV
jgi:aspartate dehydrogenase